MTLVEFTREDGKSCLINMDNVTEVHPDNRGSLIFFIGSNDNMEYSTIVRESFERVCDRFQILQIK